MTVIILAGGRSERMGTDKAFLLLGRRTFISIIVEAVSGISDDVVVVIGKKNPEPFMKEIADNKVRVVNDSNCIANPSGGILTGLEAATSKYAAVVACDLPLVKGNFLDDLFVAAKGHDAAIPVWNPNDLLSMEPLCAVYRVASMIKATKDLAKGAAGPKRAVLTLPDVNYVPVSELRRQDPELGSLRNINTEMDYHDLLKRLARPVTAPRPTA